MGSIPIVPGQPAADLPPHCALETQAPWIVTSVHDLQRSPNPAAGRIHEIL